MELIFKIKCLFLFVMGHVEVKKLPHILFELFYKFDETHKSTSLELFIEIKG